MVFNMTTAGVVWSKSGFSSVNGIAVDDEGNYCGVADPTADQVAIFDARSGNLIQKTGGLGNPYYLDFNNENHTFIVSGSTGLISVLDTLGQVVHQVQNPDRTGKIALAY
jgi:hypothetical protein